MNMRLRDIAMKNIIRRKGKMALIIIGLAVGIATLVSIITVMLAFQKNIDQQLSTYGFNIVIYPASSNLSLNYGGMSISGVDAYEVKSLSMDDLEKIRSLQMESKIMAISPKLLQPADIKGEQALLIGTDFKQEFSVKKWWRLASGKKPSSPKEVIVGADAAKKLKLNAGDFVELNGQKFAVSGVLQSAGSQDDNLIFCDLKQVQSLYGRGKELSLIEVTARDSGDTDLVVKALEKALPQASVSSIKQAVKFKEKAMSSLIRFGLTVSAIVIIISGFVVLTTMSLAVIDRKREIGIFRAIGYRQSTIFKIILIEALILSLIGGIAGYASGFGLIYTVPILFKKVNLVVKPNIFVLALSVGMSVLVGLISSLLPAKKAASMDPADALKSL
ncbi:MAG: ABC transporter permease [Actinomycetota bacterium]